LSQPDLLAAVSDIHGGSLHGLCPPEGIELQGGARFIPTTATKERWSYWLDYWREVAARKKELGAKLSVLLNGDLVDGTKYQDESIDTGGSIQIKVATACLGPMLACEPEHVFVTRGTPSHVGRQAEYEEVVARRAGAMLDPKTKTHAAYFWLLQSHGRTIFATHHPPQGWRLVRTRGSQAALAANEVASRFWERKGEDGRPLTPPHLAIFAHKHEPADSGPVLPHRHGTRALYLGAWQGKTQYAEKVAPVAWNESHGILITIWPEAWRQEMVEHFVYPLKLQLSPVEL